MGVLALPALAIRDLVRSRKVSAAEVTKTFLEQIERTDPGIRAFVTVDAAGALSAAREVDRKLDAGEAVGLLSGITVAVKDNICTNGLPTTCSSRGLENFVAPYDAYVVTRLRQEDAVIIGKTNMDEFAMGSSTENSGFFTTRNPWDRLRIPGGSSGGSAAAIAANMASLALGSDTGGSIRQPAAMCGVVGLKPTYGRVSRYGLVAFASSLDQIGPIASNIRDAALLASVISGYDSRDSTCVNTPVPDYLAELERESGPATIGMPREYFGKGTDPEVESALRTALGVLRGTGLDVREISLPHTEYAVATYYLVATAEASSNLARYDGVHYGTRGNRLGDIVELFSSSRERGFGSEVKRRVMLGTYALSAGYYDAYYLKASRVRALIKNDFDRALKEVDFVLCPTAPTAAFKIGEKIDDPLQMYLSDIYTISANLAGIPGISVPCGRTRDGLPIGMQVLGRPFDESGVLRLAYTYEREMAGQHRA